MKIITFQCGDVILNGDNHVNQILVMEPPIDSIVTIQTQ